MSRESEHESQFASRVRSIRKHHGWTAQRLADACGMTRAAISKIECRERNVSLGEAIVIAEALGVPLLDMCSPDPVVIKVEMTATID